MKKKNVIVPPADIILDVINDEPHAADVVLTFYDDYILAAAKEPKYGKDGEYIDHIVNSDLAQEIRLAVFNCLPSLRKAFHKRFFKKSPVVVVIARESTE
ncbi:MAG: helix-turn-helix domain-containing protein [Clostridia bacterium]|nr:helix-turn-helix domain-containing protein [Clostridia bacterium]